MQDDEVEPLIEPCYSDLNVIVSELDIERSRKCDRLLQVLPDERCSDPNSVDLMHHRRYGALWSLKAGRRVGHYDGYHSWDSSMDLKPAKKVGSGE